MLPKTQPYLLDGFDIEKQPNKTYHIDRERDIMVGFCDGLEAVRQAVYLILSIERYDWIIYSWSYGVELKDLYGKQTAFVLPELKRRIKDALMQDDRITEVDQFSFEAEKKKVHATFTVHSIYGDIEAEKEVEI